MTDIEIRRRFDALMAIQRTAHEAVLNAMRNAPESEQYLAALRDYHKVKNEIERLIEEARSRPNLRLVKDDDIQN